MNHLNWSKRKRIYIYEETRNCESAVETTNVEDKGGESETPRSGPGDKTLKASS